MYFARHMLSLSNHIMLLHKLSQLENYHGIWQAL
jgi:hypothetical protein